MRSTVWSLVFLLNVALAAHADGPSQAAPEKEPSSATVSWRRTQRCGVNSLYVMLRMHGTPVSYEELARETAIGDQGTTLTELARVGRLHGLDLTSVFADRESVDGWPLPAIIHLERQNLDRHYVLLLRQEGEQFVTMDCTSGEVSFLGEGEFRDKWTGYALLNLPGHAWKLSSTASYVWLIGGAMVVTVGVFRWRKSRRIYPRGGD